MGSFTKPKYAAMPAPQIVYMPSPFEGGGAGAGAGGDGQASDDVKRAMEATRRTLPETILTSYRGVLEEGEWMPQRKSLLGE